MIQELSKELLTLKKEIAEIEERHAAELDFKKENLKLLQSAFIDELTKQGLKSIKTTEANFSIATRHGFTFTNEVETMKWAKKNNLVSLDKTRAAQVLKEMDKLPSFVQKVENNYLTIKETNKE